jgi:hypothetical protein
LLVLSLEQFTSTRIIHFFCGLHAEKHPLPAATIMIKSLIFQLMSQQAFDLTFLRNDHLWKIAQNELNTLCTLFGALVVQLPSHVALFCIIDGIDFYETHERRLDMSIVVSNILDLIIHGDVHAVFKFLVTSPSTTESVKVAFHPDDVISIPETVPRTDYDLGERHVAAFAAENVSQWQRYLITEAEDKVDEIPSEMFGISSQQIEEVISGSWKGGVIEDEEVEDVEEGVAITT